MVTVILQLIFGGATISKAACLCTDDWLFRLEDDVLEGVRRAK